MAQFLDQNGLTYFWGKVKDYVDSSGGGSLTSLAVTLETSKWTENDDGFFYQSVTATGVTANNTVFVSAQPSQIDMYAQSNIRALSQSANSLRFRSDEIPEEDLTVYIVIS